MEFREPMFIIGEEDEILSRDRAICRVALGDIGSAAIDGGEAEGISNMLHRFEAARAETVGVLQAVEECNAIALGCQNQLRYFGGQLRKGSDAQRLRSGF